MLSSRFLVLFLYVGPGLPFQRHTLRQQRRRFRLYIHDVEQRLQSFWESQSFGVVEHIVNHVLTKGLPTSRLLLPLSHCNMNDDINEQFYSFYNGNFSYIGDWSEKPSIGFYLPRRKKRSYRFVLAYAGHHFCGWQRQPNNHNLLSVQEVVESAIESAFTENGRPDVRVAGRTDAGVSALGQVARVRILFSKNVGDSVSTANQILYALDDAARLSNYKWRCLALSEVSDSFHPTFDSTSRSYIYGIDVNAKSKLCKILAPTEFHCISADSWENTLLDQFVIILNSQLESLEGKELDYIAFSHGQVKTETTICCLNHAKVRLCKQVLSSDEDLVLIFEFTGNRFLRRMVRMLVGTSMFLALEQMLCHLPSSSTTLHSLCHSKQRNRRWVKTAPPGGLIFIGAQCLDRRFF